MQLTIDLLQTTLIVLLAWAVRGLVVTTIRMQRGSE